MNVVVYGDNAALSTQQKDLLQGDLEGRAAANLIVTVTDPTVVNVDIRIEFVTKPGYSSSSVIAAVKQRLQEYLSVYNWPWEGTVRRYEIISIVDQVPGVDYVTTLFDPATDLTYSGSTLVRAGRLQVSVPGETTAEFTTTAVLTVSAEGIS